MRKDGANPASKSWEGKRPVVLLFDDDGILPQLADIYAVVLKVNDDTPDSVIVPRLLDEMTKKTWNFNKSVEDIINKIGRHNVDRFGFQPLYRGRVDVVAVDKPIWEE